ncbi:hypothetical protein BD413DRAFT_474084 [Trametes elegans]|nr:hypothetical protein BD413DRAFT_474084 [Trametes elegans]
MHGNDFVPGVVRLVCAGEVLVDGQPISFKEKQGGLTKTWTKHRSTLTDSGLDLELAESVNDILMTFYDLLEVHRTIARERRMIHRDISLSNVLMYPTAAQCAGASWVKAFLPLIDDVLRGCVDLAYATGLCAVAKSLTAMIY